MAKNLDRKFSGVPFENQHHPGCMWGVFHVLGFHQWHSIKKMLPYKRHGGIRTSRMKLNIPDTGEMQEFIDSEMDDSLIQEKMNDTSPTSNKSSKARMKELISEEMAKEEVQKRWFSSLPSRFVRTDSIHHLEPSHCDLPDEVRKEGESTTHITSSWDPLLPKILAESVNSCKWCQLYGPTMNTMEHNQLHELRRQILEKHALKDKLYKATETLSKQKGVHAKKLHKHVGLHQSKEFLDALEIFNVNEELFLKILQDPDYALAHHFPGHQDSNAKRGLTKSGSFPLPDLSGRKYLRPCKLKYKQKLQARNPPSMLTTGEPSEDIYVKNILNTDHGRLEAGETGSDLYSSPGHPHELKKWGKNRVVMNHFKDIKRRIKLAIKESRKEGHRISMDAILHKIPTCHRKESAVDIDSKESPRSSYESDVSFSSLGKSRLHRIRTSSLDESLDRYSQLYDSSFGREAKRHLSNRLKLRTEDGGSPFGHSPKALGRILSLPDLESYCSLQSEMSGYALCPGTPTRILEDSNITHTENRRQLDAFVESGRQENLVELGANSLSDRNAIMCEKIDDMDNVENGEVGYDSQYEQQIGSPNNASSKLVELNSMSVLDSCFQEDIISPTKFSIAEVGPELKPKHIHHGELDSLVNLQDQSVMESISEAETTRDVKDLKFSSKHFDNDFCHVQVDTKDEADFNYVRDVLKLSGFSGNKYLEAWHSPDQPVNPSLFEEVEAFSPLKPNCVGGDVGSSYDHQLLFDIINEVLLEIYDRSFTYWPLPLSCNCHIRPMPMRDHVLGEVWASVRWYLSSEPEPDPLLDYVVARDLSKGDEWMNLQFDSECVGLELEDIILDDLLEEIIYT